MRFLSLLNVLLLIALPNSLLAANNETCEESIGGCLQATEKSALSIHEPMYFIAGGEYKKDLKARFQFSFKYQIFDQESSFINALPWLKTFHLSYTQTSLWNWSEDSLPFEDTSYKPSLYFILDKSPVYDLLSFGYTHESNGQAGETSRSIDGLFIQPVWSIPLANSSVIISPRFLYYLRKGELNEDIHKYRGYTDLNLRYGNEDSWGFNTLYRYGNADHHSLQLDITYPIRTPISMRTGGFLYLQYFHGYGESLLNYDQNVGPIFRIGLGIVR